MMNVPAKKLDMPNVVTRDATPNKFANTIEVKEFPGAVANPNAKPKTANAANVWHRIIANALIAAIPLETINTTMGLTDGRSEMAPNKILANVFAPPINDTM